MIRMITTMSKWILFISSYIPLYIIFFIQGSLTLIEDYLNYLNKNKESHTFHLLCVFLDLNKNKLIVLLLLVILSLLSFLLMLYVLKGSSRSENFSKIYNIEKYNPAITEYVLVYILPFISTSIYDLKDLITFLIIFFIIGTLQVKNDLVYTNPILYGLNYNIYIFKYNSPDTFDNCILITKYTIIDLKREGRVLEDKSILTKMSMLSKCAYYIKKR